MKKVGRCLLAGILFLTLSGCHSTAARTAEVVNAVDQAWIGFYLAPAGTTDWSSNLLRVTLDYEESAEIEYWPEKSSLWDVKVQTVEGDFYQMQNVAFREGAKLYLTLDSEGQVIAELR